MTARGFLFLLIFTVIAIAVGAWVADRYTSPGFERTLVVAIIASAIVFPAGWWAEKKGWIKGTFKFGREPEPTKEQQSGSDPTGGRQ